MSSLRYKRSIAKPSESRPYLQIIKQIFRAIISSSKFKLLYEKTLYWSYAKRKDICDDHTETSGSSNLADLLLDLLADLPPQYWHLLVKNGNWQIYPQYWHLVVKMTISYCYCYSLSRQINWQIYPPVLMSSGQEWQFHIATVTAHIGRSTGRSTPLPSSIKHRCLEYHYTNLGRSTGRSTPQSSIDALSTVTPTVADLLADLPPHPQPPSIKQRCLEEHYTKLVRSPPSNWA